MDDLYFNLASEEFSKSRKILIWIIAIITLLFSLWVSYLLFFTNDEQATKGLAITLYLVTAFMFMIAFLATKKRKEHFFKVDNEVIAYHYGLLFPSYHSYSWPEINKIYVPPHSKNTILILNNGKVVHINLTWVEKNKARIIRKHVFYTGRDKGIEIVKGHYKK